MCVAVCEIASEFALNPCRVEVYLLGAKMNKTNYM